MGKKRGESGLVQAGAIPVMKTLVRKFAPPTKAHLALLDSIAVIAEAPDAAERAFMARQLVQCTLPHTDPEVSYQRIPGTRKRQRIETPVPVWQRETSTFALLLQPGWDRLENKSIGYPYGTIPRLLLFWIITEALRTKQRRLVLGRSLAEFMRAVGLDPSRGGKRSDQRRLKEQMRRLFKCRITFDQTATDRDRTRDMTVAPDSDLWWHPTHIEQAALWESWIELGEKFFQAIMLTPVPIDMRALKALKRSPLALDLYAWVCYRAFVIVQKNERPQFTAWTKLMQQLGADYGTANDFQKKAAPVLRKIERLYPGLKIGKAKGGFTIHAARLAVPQKAVQKPVDKQSYPR
jgi:hypothetical protein